MYNRRRIKKRRDWVGGGPPTAADTIAQMCPVSPFQGREGSIRLSFPFNKMTTTECLLRGCSDEIVTLLCDSGTLSELSQIKKALLSIEMYHFPGKPLLNSRNRPTYNSFHFYITRTGKSGLKDFWQNISRKKRAKEYTLNRRGGNPLTCSEAAAVYSSILSAEKGKLTDCRFPRNNPNRARESE